MWKNCIKLRKFTEKIRKTVRKNVKKKTQRCKEKKNCEKLIKTWRNCDKLYTAMQRLKKLRKNEIPETETETLFIILLNFEYQC